MHSYHIISIYGYEIKIPLGAFVECASSLYQNKSHEAIWLLKYGLTIYPNATELYAVIAEIYEYMNEIDLAKTYYNSAFLNAKNNSIEKLKYNVLSKKFNKQKIENHND